MTVDTSRRETEFCRRGHPVSGENVIVKDDGTWLCRECLESYKASLAIANTVKHKQYEWRVKVRRYKPYRTAWRIAAHSLRGTLPPSSALGKLTIDAWLLAWPGIDRVTADRLLATAKVGHHRRLRDLTERERLALADALERMAGGAAKQHDGVHAS